jgi:hypothetical protein
MFNFIIKENSKNLTKIAHLYTEIFDNTSYAKKEAELLNEWQKIILNNGIILTVEAEEFDYPFAFAVLKKEGDRLVIESQGIKKEFINQGVWDYLYKFIEEYIDKNHFKEIQIYTNPSIFPEIYNVIKDNNFEEKKKNLGQEKSQKTFIKTIN